MTPQETGELGTYRQIPRHCTCTWQWITSSGPWRWQLTHVNPSCTVHNPPADDDATAIIENGLLSPKRTGGRA